MLNPYPLRLTLTSAPTKGTTIAGRVGCLHARTEGRALGSPSSALTSDTLPRLCAAWDTRQGEPGRLLCKGWYGSLDRNGTRLWIEGNH